MEEYMKKQINILNDTILSLGSKAVGMILFMATDIMIARFLSTESYDEWSFFYAIITMCYWLVWFGINESVRVFVAKERKNIKRQNSNIRIGIKLRLLISGLFLLLFTKLIECAKLLIFIQITHFCAVYLM